jgi:flavodoxin
VKILVAYFSETGNTKAIAEAIGEEATVGGHDVDIKTVGEISASQLSEYDVVFLGSTCHSADVAAPLKDIMDGLPEDPELKLAGFVTHSTVMPEGGGWQEEMYEQWAGKCPATFDAAAEEKGIEFLGFFHCQGAPNPQIEAFIRSTIITDEKQWAEYIEDVRKHPTTEDVQAAREFTRSVLAKVKY